MRAGRTALSRREIEQRVTFIVKTFERPTVLRRLLASTRCRYRDAKVLVADDSRRPAKDVDATLFRLPFDVGLSHGRNFLLDRVETPFFLLLDDDYVFDEGSRIEDLLAILLETDIDIAAGEWFRWGRPSRFFGLLEREGDTLVALSGRRGEIGGCALYDFLPNFFVGRTDAVRDVRWDEELKLGEHLDFFWRAKQQGLRVALEPQVTITHAPEAPRAYRPYRRRAELEFRTALLRKYGLRRLDNRVTGRSWSLLSDGTLYAEPASLRSRVQPRPGRRTRMRRATARLLAEARRVSQAGPRQWLGVPLRRLATSNSRAFADFLIVGAQDAGGEALWDHLVGSGWVVPPSRPDIGFFAQSHWRGQRWYRSHFPALSELGDGQITGEATCSYLFHPAAASRVAVLLPSVKLIVLVCDPVTRGWRQFLRQRRLGREPLPTFRQALLGEADRVFPAWQRARWDPLFPDHALQRFSYVWGGHYADQLRGWLEHVARDQILVLQTERLTTAPAEELRRTYDFLGIPAQPEDVRLTLPTDDARMDPGLQRILREHFAERDAQLAELLGEPLAWKEAGRTTASERPSASSAPSRSSDI